ncbi:hypothetical protein FORC38_1259 [Salmonella enterica]|uniref:Uncharacterized protein n=1 Tax=Escherichia coli TaxID=562 RepID=A0A2R4A7K2_ECOLX|nr:hypothetical protein FORC38_1259 [Salmonella enterica]AVR60547.1 hypothetical protein [Escherichia coli]
MRKLFFFGFCEHCQISSGHLLYKRTKVFGKKGFGIRVMCWARLRLIEAIGHE